MIQRTILAIVLLLGAAANALAEDRWLTLPEPPPLPAPAQSGMAAVNGIEMHYAVFGTTGEPILLIHGGLGNADIWGFQVPELMKTHKVIVADSRGHGRSTRDAKPFGYDLMTADYIALLDYLKIEKTALVGWSDGGIIGLDMAINHRERLSKLFAQAANATVDGVDPKVANDPTFAHYIDWMGKDYARLSPTPNEYNAFLEQISKMWATEPAFSKDELESITTPTAIVLGDHDEAITRAHTDYLAATIPGAKLIILPEASHFAMLQDPVGYTQAILDFLGSE